MDDDDRDLGGNADGHSDKIKELEKGLQGLGSDDDDDDLTNGLGDAIKDLQAQLGPDSDEQGAPLPDVAQISTLLSMDAFLKDTGKAQTKEFFLKLLTRKEKFLGLIQTGKVTPEAYNQLLEKKLAQTNNHPKIVKCVGEELSLLAECDSQKAWLSMLLKKCQKSMAAQMAIFPQTKNQVQQQMEPPRTMKAEQQKVEAVRNQQPPQPPQQATRPPQQFTSQQAPQSNTNIASEPANKQQALIQKLDQAAPQKKAEIVLKSLAKVESLIMYYKQNMPERKAKEINEQLLPKRELALKVVQALLVGKDVPIGDFVMNKMPKVDFERFHNCTRKEFYSNVETICKKYKDLERAERDFKKKIGRSSENTDTSNRTNQMLKQYEDDLEFLNSIKTKDFVPLPSVKVSSEERENFVENTKLQKNDLQITISKIEGVSGHAELKIYFQESNNARSVFEINEGTCNVDFLLKVTEEALKEITKKVVKVKIEGKKMLVFNSVLAYVEISLADFANKNMVQGVAESGNVKITYQFNMRTPRNRVTKTKISTIMMKRFPEYVYDPTFETDFLKRFINHSETVKPIEQPKPQPQQPVVVQQQPQKAPVPQQQQALIPLFYAQRTEESQRRMASVSVQGFTPDNIVRPEIYSDCISYLARMDDVLDKAMNQSYAFKVNKRLIEEIQDEIMKKKGFLENSRKAGRLPNEQYANLLQSNIQRDQGLAQVFTLQNFPQMAAFLNTRVQVTVQQLNSLVAPPQQQVVQQQQQTQPIEKKPSTPQIQPQPQQPPSQLPRQTSTKTEQPPSTVPKVSPQQGATTVASKQFDLSQYPLFYVKRTPEMSQALAALSAPLDYIDPAKIKSPETQCFSVKYLTDFEGVLDKIMGDTTVDKANRNQAEDLQDLIMKNKMVMEKKKAGMTPEQYRQLVTNNIEQDQKLFEIYKKLNLVELQQFILGRIRLMKVELGEPPVMIIVKNTFDLNEVREVSDIARTAESIKVLEKFGVELQRPELPQFCNCLTYLEKMIEVSKSPELVKALNAAKDRFGELAEKGEMDEQKYAALIRKNKEDDISRLDVYRKLDLKEFYLFIKARLKLIEEQLANL